MSHPEMNQLSKERPLDGVKVLEYAVFHAGPGAGAILGDLGAEVIKIEGVSGDPMRYWTEVGDLDMTLKNGESMMYEAANRNKKDICLDIKSERGREIFNRLVQNTDVFITNLRKSTKAELAIDYESLSAVNPRLIHANVSGYGPKGLMSNTGAFDPMGQARAGMMFVTGSQEPMLMQLAILDQATAIAASHAIMAALFFRERHGIGQEVHVSLYSTAMWLMYCNFMMLGLLSRDSTLTWVRSENSPLRNSFCCKDGKWIIGVHHPEKKYWSAFCKATGQTQLMDDPRFADDSLRLVHSSELVDMFDKIFATKTRDEWLERFRIEGLMFSPIQYPQEVLSDPQALANDYIVDFDHPAYGTTKIPGYPASFSFCQAGTRSAAPVLGEHTSSILSEMGYTNATIEELDRDGVIRIFQK